MSLNRLPWMGGNVVAGLSKSAAQALCPLAGINGGGLSSRLPAALLAWSVGGVRGPKRSTRKVPVILLKDTPNLGFRGEEVAVRPGYARNFLVPQQLVVYSTHENKLSFLQEKDAEELARQEEAQRIQRLQKRLAKLDLTIRRHVHDNDVMYGSVTAKNIADKLEKSGLKVTEKDVLLEEPIKALGTFEVKLRLPSADQLPVKLNVVKR